MNPSTSTLPFAMRLFQFSSRAWFICLLLAQLVFVTYLALGYGIASIQNQLTKWNTFNTNAFVEGDTIGNLFYGLHVLLAIVMILGGSLQLIPNIRNRHLRFHRYNGRFFVILACTISLAGMYLILVRGTVGNAFLHSMTFFSGTVVLVASFFAVSTAMKKQIASHEVWATRLFLAANGVLFFRLCIFAWFMLFGTFGVNTEDFTGPTVYAVSVCSYLLPLLVFEWVRYTKKNKAVVHQLLVSILMILTASVFLIGLAGITLGSWYPSLFN